MDWQMWLIAVLGLASAALIVRWFLVVDSYDLTKEHTWRYRFSGWRYSRRRRRNAHPDCREPAGVCRGKDHEHARCVLCGDLTCHRGLYLEEHSLRRRVGPRCAKWSCHDSAQESLRQQRTYDDWERLTTPIVANMLIPAMGEQYPGPTRTALRAFLDSDMEEATIAEASPGALNGSIAALGLHDRIYAEQRGNDTVLRRIEQE